jgi:uncharacterized membrane protein (DUF2068 family)
MAKKESRHKEHPRGLLVIAAFKLLKGLALLAVGIAAPAFLSKDVGPTLEHWANLFRVDPHNHYIHLLIEKLSLIDAKKLKEFRVGTFIYAAVFLTEGIGLALRKRWAEYMTILTTGSFLPLEVYEIFKHATLAKVILLLFNIAIVIYLVFELRRNPKHV